MSIGFNVSQFLERGGPVMWPLLACSVIGLALVLERWLFHLRHRSPGRRFPAKLLALLRDGDTSGARALCGKYRHPVARIAAIYLDNASCPDALRQDILRREGSRRLEEVEQNLRYLSVIAHLSPLLGLLGTVTGLVSSFHVIEKLEGAVQPAQLAAGIWESLLTTVFGLVIAIPCLAAFHLFEQRADAMARHMQFIISELNEFFGKRNGDLALPHAEGDDDMTVVK